ncbi:hypothetical protein X802_04895 [Thermococcus guaymasensis DSM 11113]|uniref:Uncharacterized protein n=1 Tax=Thermococcus guaymasensis DSM 11113 TaxID=1432656 RepID=A0A0X1KJX9_9EURY|nr:hypothetical protein [Thermococcus guaymasensis]AJC71581.1 hypothetical protein X802_04895 [Thermococcus guaymasensis DSM 11113]
MRRLQRRLYSLIPLVFSGYLLYTTAGEWALLLFPLALIGIHWHFFGMIFLIGTGIILVYKNIGGVLGLSIVALALLAVEMGQMDRERAPYEHYAVLVLATFLSIPTYLLIYTISPFLPKLEVTAIAAGLVLALYLFTKTAGEG